MLNLYTKYTRRPRSVETTEWVLYITQCGDMIYFSFAFQYTSIINNYLVGVQFHCSTLRYLEVSYMQLNITYTSLWTQAFIKFRVRWVLYKRTHGPPKEVYIVLFHPMTAVHTPPAILGAAPSSLAHIGSIFSGNIHKPLIVNNLNKYTQL